jgi:hypothetical protein
LVKTVCMALVVALNAVLTVYAAGVVWLWAVWPLGDSRGAAMTRLDWWVGSAARVVQSLLVAVAVAGLLFAVNSIATRYHALSPRWRSRLSVGAGLVVLVAGSVGAVEFLVSKPVF